MCPVQQGPVGYGLKESNSHVLRSQLANKGSVIGADGLKSFQVAGLKSFRQEQK